MWQPRPVFGTFSVILFVAGIFIVFNSKDGGSASLLQNRSPGDSSSPPSLIATPTGVPSSWLSDKDLAASPLLHTGKEPVYVFGGGLGATPSAISHVSEHSVPQELLASSKHEHAEISRAPILSSASQQLVQTPEKVEGLHREGMEQAKHVQSWEQDPPSKQMWHSLVAKAEASAERLSRLHPRSVIGAHWRLAVESQPRETVLAGAEQAAQRAKSDEEKQLHDLRVAQQKQEGVYAPRQALVAMGVAPAVAREAAQAQGSPTSQLTKKDASLPPKAPARYPAVSFFAQLRELGNSQMMQKHMSHRQNTPEGIRARELARTRIAQKFQSLSNGGDEMHEDVSTSEGDGEMDSQREDEGGKQRDGHATSVSLYGYGNRGDSDYAGDVPTDFHKRTHEDEERERLEARARVQEAQRRLQAKWRRLMANPPPVTSSTRPDVVPDTDKGAFPDEDVFRQKKKEMRAFGAAVRGFESDPEFNPMIVVLAHSLTRYGVPPPETEDPQVWRTWYEEVTDKYHVLEQQVAALATGKVTSGVDHGERDHRNSRRTVQVLPQRPDDLADSIRSAFTAQQRQASWGRSNAPAVADFHVQGGQEQAGVWAGAKTGEEVRDQGGQQQQMAAQQSDVRDRQGETWSDAHEHGEATAEGEVRNQVRMQDRVRLAAQALRRIEKLLDPEQQQQQLAGVNEQGQKDREEARDSHEERESRDSHESYRSGDRQSPDTVVRTSSMPEKSAQGEYALPRASEPVIEWLKGALQAAQAQGDAILRGGTPSTREHA